MQQAQLARLLDKIWCPPANLVPPDRGKGLHVVTINGKAFSWTQERNPHLSTKGGVGTRQVSKANLKRCAEDAGERTSVAARRTFWIVTGCWLDKPEEEEFRKAISETLSQEQIDHSVEQYGQLHARTCDFLTGSIDYHLDLMAGGDSMPLWRLADGQWQGRLKLDDPAVAKGVYLLKEQDDLPDALEAFKSNLFLAIDRSFADT